ncbi:MAG: restriction endonuclease subunit S [Leadbetterella sp.]|nr:restriction endonuclease subunit S [Leadbetterella sp.]
MDAKMTNRLNIDKKDWTLVKFGDVVSEGRETVKDFAAENIQHVVGLEHIDTENIHLTRSENMEGSTTFTKKFKKGDVLFGRRRAYLKKAAQASFDGICSGDITVLRAKKGLQPELLPFLVCNDKFFDYAIKHSAGGLSPRVKFKDLANYEFLLPPKDQQAKLAELLWAMDGVVEKEMRVLDTVVSTKRAFFKQFRKADKSCLLSDLADVSYGLGQPPAKDKNGVPMIRATDISKGKISNSNLLMVSRDSIPKGKNVNLKEGDIIIVRSGAYTGDLAIISKEFIGAIAGYDLIIRPNQKKIDPSWLIEYLLEKDAQLYFKGESIRSAQPHLNSQQVLNTCIPVFSLGIQKKTDKV